MSDRDREACCEHGLEWHHGTRGCGYHGFYEEQRCQCFLIFSQALAAHDAEVRAEAAEKIAVAIEELDAKWNTPPKEGE